MEITKSTIKALASDTRLEILKILSERKKIPADLAKMMKLAPSTVNEHLKILEEEGLIQRKETGHKWIYFEITDKGRNLVRPKYPVQFIIILSLGVFMMIVGGLKNFLPREQAFVETVIEKTEEAGTLKTPAPGAVPPVEIDWIVILLIATGLILTIIGLYNIVKLRKK